MGNNSTEGEFRKVLKKCEGVFLAKLAEYGPSWRYLRLISLADKIFGKAKRIRKLQDIGGKGRVPEAQDVEFIGVVNYCLVGIVLLEAQREKTSLDAIEGAFDGWNDATHAANEITRLAERAVELFRDKNHDYDEAWKSMEIETLTDEILLRMLRVKQLLRGAAAAAVIESQFLDTLNYSVFALIKLNEESN